MLVSGLWECPKSVSNIELTVGIAEDEKNEEKVEPKPITFLSTP
jgi:hypothetical protein